ncbi:MAG: UvrD-helicase domain-containing protein [Butyrivibrio sp.]|nr:UvrD-helicase domain-containing protein [Butyrivibrio sp.]
MSIYDTLNEQQKKAVLTTQGPVLVLAGAGSGKTRALTHRIAYLIEEEGVSPFNILAITFTNKAAGEMRERAKNICALGEQVWVSTFHSTCVRILRRYIDRLGYDNNFTIYDTDDQKGIIKEVCKKLSIDTKMLKERTIMSAISSAKDELISPKEYEMQGALDYNSSRIAKAYREYQDTLRKNNALDFDDLIVKTVELFKICPEVLNSYQDRFRYIMVDEYQDTNTAQFELIRLLADKYRNLCVVGDDDQSIYKFRGANIRNILDFEKVYPEACVIKLEQNYRSTQNVLDAANAVIKNNAGRKDKELWTRKENGSLIHFRRFDTAYEEAEYITQDIDNKKIDAKADYGDCAVLYRTNAQSRMLEERFIMKGIPYQVVGGVNFYSRREIKDILAYLKTIDNGRDDVAVKRIINVPKRGIGTTTIQRIQDYADSRNISFYDAMREADQIMTIGKSASKIKPFVTMIQVFRSKLEFVGINDLIEDILETTGYVKELEASGDEDAEDRVENIYELVSKAAAYAQQHEEAVLSEFLEEVALVADIDQVEDGNNRVLLMTLHSAKGLEFPHVYLAGLEDGVFPSYMTTVSDDLAELEEERRLAYVGITRAKDDLTITCARSRMIHGETQYNPVSRFVKEIPPLLMDNKLPEPGYSQNKQDLSFNPDNKPNEDIVFFGSKYENTDRGYSRNGAVTFSDNRHVDTDDSYSRSGAGSYQRQFGKNVDTIFDKPKVAVRVKATVKPKRTAYEDQPYITRASAEMAAQTSQTAAGNGAASGTGSLGYEQGDRVRHQKYGEGTVMKIEPGARDYQVTVVFDEAGQKIMYAGFAKLKKV